MLRYLKDKLKEDLYSNSIYLMISTAIMTGLGFFFWTINARLFSSHELGLATTIISIFTLITTICGFGLGVALIRFLPSSNVKNRKINSAFSIAILASIAISSIFIYSFKYISEDLSFIEKNLFLSIGFILAVIFAVLFNLIESVFIAYKSTKFVLIKNLMFSLSKLIFPFIFISLLAYGIFLSWAASLFIAFTFSFFVLIFKFKYKPSFSIYDSIIKKIFSFSLGNHLSALIRTLPISLMPIIITNMLTPSDTAYFYIAYNIAGLLFVIPTSVGSSLLAKVSETNSNYKLVIKKALLFISLLLIPAIILFLLFDKYLLLLFGKEYLEKSLLILNLFVVSSIFVAIYNIYSSYLNLKKKIKKLIFMNLVISISTLVLSYYLIGLGLYGIGLAYLISQSLVLLFVLTK